MAGVPCEAGAAGAPPGDGDVADPAQMGLPAPHPHLSQHQLKTHCGGAEGQPGLGVGGLAPQQTGSSQAGSVPANPTCSACLLPSLHLRTHPPEVTGSGFSPSQGSRKQAPGPGSRQLDSDEDLHPWVLVGAGGKEGRGGLAGNILACQRHGEIVISRPGQGVRRLQQRATDTGDTK